MGPKDCPETSITSNPRSVKSEKSESVMLRVSSNRLSAVDCLSSSFEQDVFLGGGGVISLNGGFFPYM